MKKHEKNLLANIHDVLGSNTHFITQKKFTRSIDYIESDFETGVITFEKGSKKYELQLKEVTA